MGLQQYNTENPPGIINLPLLHIKNSIPPILANLHTFYRVENKTSGVDK